MITLRDTQGAFRKPTSIIRNTRALLEKYSGPEVQVCGTVVNK